MPTPEVPASLKAILTEAAQRLDPTDAPRVRERFALARMILEQRERLAVLEAIVRVAAPARLPELVADMRRQLQGGTP